MTAATSVTKRSYPKGRESPISKRNGLSAAGAGNATRVTAPFWKKYGG